MRLAKKKRFPLLPIRAPPSRFLSLLHCESFFLLLLSFEERIGLNFEEREIEERALGYSAPSFFGLNYTTAQASKHTSFVVVRALRKPRLLPARPTSLISLHVKGEGEKKESSPRYFRRHRTGLLSLSPPSQFFVPFVKESEEEEKRIFFGPGLLAVSLGWGWPCPCSPGAPDRPKKVPMKMVPQGLKPLLSCSDV